MNAVAAPKKRTFWGWVAVIALFLAFLFVIFSAVSFIFGTLVNKHVESKYVVDTPLPGFELPVFGDPSRKVGHQDLRGAPFIITTWASWCYACAHEHPAMERLANTKRIRMIGLNMQDDPDWAKRWLAKHGNPYSMILVDETGAVADRFGVMATPHHILVDAQGMIRWRLPGTMSEDVIEQQLLPLLDRLEPAGQKLTTSRAQASPTVSKPKAVASAGPRISTLSP
jgi:cytochrome c biogenesis protein CcmG, thiol:disulfide interchange protein DsbE